jgi:formylglycine-generating enzyme required for sulfatase activity
LNLKIDGAKIMKKGIVWLVFFVVGIVAMSFAQEEIKGVRIKQMKNNAGKRWAICIGINDYEDKAIIDLKKARNDARELGKVLKEYGQFDRVYVMTDDLNPRDEDYPKLMNIKRKLDFLKGFIDPEDLVLFSFSGHGIANSAGEGFLVMADSYRQNFQGSSLKVKEIIEWLKEVKVKKSLLLMDACREQFIESKAINLNGLKAERFLKAEVGAVFYSTKSGWFSYEDANGNFGVFTRYVIDGLKGEADSNKIAGNEDSIITFSELASYVEESVSNWALNEGKRQRPYTKIFGEKYGDLALSAYEPDVKAVESKASKVYKNDRGFWEAEFDENIKMVYIPAGKFNMGSENSYGDEKPIHNVNLDGYWIGKYEVTYEQFKRFIDSTSHKTDAERNKNAYVFDGDEWKEDETSTWEENYFDEYMVDHPVVCVTWNDCLAYTAWLSNKTGLNFRLPTEAEWEKAARGIDGRKYPWGDSFLALPPSQVKVGSIYGKVLLENGSMVPGALVILYDDKGKIVKTGISNVKGTFRFLKLSSLNNYSIKAELEGFKMLIYKNIKVKDGFISKVDLIMETAVIREEITRLSKKTEFSENIPQSKANFADIQFEYEFEKSWANKNFDDGYSTTSPVGSFPYGASPYKVMDMAGNVWEWCLDWYNQEYYKSCPGMNPKGPVDGSNRVIRGGGWCSTVDELRSSNRNSKAPSYASDFLGFRLVMIKE